MIPPCQISYSIVGLLQQIEDYLNQMLIDLLGIGLAKYMSKVKYRPG